MTERLDKQLIEQSVESIFKFVQKGGEGSGDGKLALFENATSAINIQIHLEKGIEKPVQRPVRVIIPNNIFLPELQEHNLCLFCRTEDKEAITNYLSAHPIAYLTKVISMSEVIKLYKQRKDKKELLQHYSHFVCDANILPQLYNALGKDFGSSNSFPIPINYDVKKCEKLASAIDKYLLSSTYMHLRGENICICVGYTSMPVTEIVDNIIQGVNSAAEKLPAGGWKRVSSIHVKSAKSPALPLYGKKANEALDFLKKKAKELKEAEEKKEKETKKRPLETKSEAPVESKKAATAKVTPVAATEPNTKKAKVVEEKKSEVKSTDTKKKGKKGK